MSFHSFLEQATRAIGPDYFVLPIARATKPKRRERVYCYELYHQLRLAINGSALTLTGEPDKRGHPDFPGINPDFILHIPGNHDENDTVIEVECDLTVRHLIKDLSNLRVMRDRGYKRLVLLLFANQSVPWEKLRRASAEANVCINEIEIMLHREAGEPATREFPDYTAR